MVEMTPEKLAEIRQMWERYREYLQTPYGPQLPAHRADYQGLKDVLTHSVPDLLDEIDRLKQQASQAQYEVDRLCKLFKVTP